MTVYTHHYSHPEYLFKISKTAYFPQPQVDGAFVNFKLKRPVERCHVDSEKRFLSFVRMEILSVLSISDALSLGEQVILIEKKETDKQSAAIVRTRRCQGVVGEIEFF